MQNPNTARTAPQRKVSKFLDTKMLIASLSVAVTVGVWNLLANDAYVQAKNQPKPNVAPPPQSDPAQGAAEGIPTIAPLAPVTIQPQTGTNGAAQSASAPAAGAAAGQLRSVTAPTQAVVQKVKPQFGQSVDVVVVNGGGGGGGGGAAATTRSSR